MDKHGPSIKNVLDVLMGFIGRQLAQIVDRISYTGGDCYYGIQIRLNILYLKNINLN
jgi:hypothetical protein